jgi:hypothetical protein
MDIYADSQNLVSLPSESSVRHPVESQDVTLEKVSIGADVEFRGETFGALLYRTNPLAMVLVNHGAAAFLKDAARKSEGFSLASFLEQSGARTEAEQRGVRFLYQKLLRKGFLVEFTSNEGR